MMWRTYARAAARVLLDSVLAWLFVAVLVAAFSSAGVA
jgi:hypothetical protein